MSMMVGYYLYNLLRRGRQPGTHYSVSGCRWEVRVMPHRFVKPSQILKAIAWALVPVRSTRESDRKHLRKRENRRRQRDPVYRRKAREAAIAWESKSTAEKALIYGIAAIAGWAR